MEEYAHTCIDAGADAIVGTGNHLLKGIEIYKGRPIFYCLGNFLFHTEYGSRLSADVVENFGFPLEMTGPEVVAARKARATAAMEKDPAVFRTVLPLWTMEGDRLTSILMLPVELGMNAPAGLRAFPSPTAPEEIFPELEKVCRPYGTSLKISGPYIEVVL